MTQNSNTHQQEVRLSFTADISSNPIVCQLVSKYHLEFSIIKAQISPRKEGMLNLMLMGEKENVEAGIQHLKTQGVKVLGVAQKIYRDEERCIHCGFCTALCPTSALIVEVQTRQVLFCSDKCINCGLCTKTCPLSAMQKDVSEMHL